jgi:hypothetical protein
MPSSINLVICGGPGSMSRESKAATLIRWELEARQEGRDPGYTARQAECWAASFISAQVSADLANFGLAAICELTGDDFDATLAQLDRDGAVQLARA